MAGDKNNETKKSQSRDANVSNLESGDIGLDSLGQKDKTVLPKIPDIAFEQRINKLNENRVNLEKEQKDLKQEQKDFLEATENEMGGFTEENYITTHNSINEEISANEKELNENQSSIADITLRRKEEQLKKVNEQTKIIKGLRETSNRDVQGITPETSKEEIRPSVNTLGAVDLNSITDPKLQKEAFDDLTQGGPKSESALSQEIEGLKIPTRPLLKEPLPVQQVTKGKTKPTRALPETPKKPLSEIPDDSEKKVETKEAKKEVAESFSGSGSEEEATEDKGLFGDIIDFLKKIPILGQIISAIENNSKESDPVESSKVSKDVSSKTKTPKVEEKKEVEKVEGVEESKTEKAEVSRSVPTKPVPQPKSKDKSFRPLNEEELKELDRERIAKLPKHNKPLPLTPPEKEALVKKTLETLDKLNETKDIDKGELKKMQDKVQASLDGIDGLNRETRKELDGNIKEMRKLTRAKDIAKLKKDIPSLKAFKGSKISNAEPPYKTSINVNNKPKSKEKNKITQ